MCLKIEQKHSRHVLYGGPEGLTAIRRVQAIGEYEVGFEDSRRRKIFTLHAMIENEIIAHEKTRNNSNRA